MVNVKKLKWSTAKRWEDRYSWMCRFGYKKGLFGRSKPGFTECYKTTTRYEDVQTDLVWSSKDGVFWSYRENGRFLFFVRRYRGKWSLQHEWIDKSVTRGGYVCTSSYIGEFNSLIKAIEFAHSCGANAFEEFVEKKQNNGN